MNLILSLVFASSAPAHATLKWHSCMIGLLSLGRTPRERILNDLVRTHDGLKFNTYKSFENVIWYPELREFYLYRTSPKLKFTLIQGEAPDLTQLEIRVSFALLKPDRLGLNQFITAVKQLAYLAKYDLGEPLPRKGFEAFCVTLELERQTFTIFIHARHPSLAKRHELLVALADILSENPTSLLQPQSERKL